MVNHEGVTRSILQSDPVAGHPDFGHPLDVEFSTNAIFGTSANAPGIL
jgi:hypothetical protein